MGKYAPRDGIEALEQRFGKVEKRRPELTLKQMFTKRLPGRIVFRDKSFIHMVWISSGKLFLSTDNEKFI